MAVTERPQIYEGSHIPSPTPTILAVPAPLRDSEEIMQINFGPNHPSTHGVLRLVVDLSGERVVGIRAVIGYLHTGFEKNMEHKTWWKAITYPERIDYVSFQNNELVFVLAIEKLLAMEVPAKATWMRMLLAELNRIHSHLIFLGTAALEIGAISMFWYCFRERDLILDLYEMVCGTRMHTRYFQAGGLAEDIPRGFAPECRKFVEWMPKAIDQYEAMLSQNEIWLQRTQGIGLLSPADAIALGQSGPVLRASGVDWDLRRDKPYLAYPPSRLRRPGLLRTATSTTATGCGWTRCASRCGSSSSAWRGCPRGRGSRTTGRSCCRRAMSSTRRWSRSSTTSRSSPRATACPRARCT